MNKNQPKEESIVFSVRWPIRLYRIVKSYCHSKDRSLNWMIKKRMAESVGEMTMIGEKPDEQDDI